MIIFHTLSSFLDAALVWNASNTRFGYHKSSMGLSFEHIIYPKFSHLPQLTLYISQLLHCTHLAQFTLPCGLLSFRLRNRGLTIGGPYPPRFLPYPLTNCVRSTQRRPPSKITTSLHLQHSPFSFIVPGLSRPGGNTLCRSVSEDARHDDDDMSIPLIAPLLLFRGLSFT
jgi:hypothetical protein